MLSKYCMESVIPLRLRRMRSLSEDEKMLADIKVVQELCDGTRKKEITWRRHKQNGYTAYKDGDFIELLVFVYGPVLIVRDSEYKRHYIMEVPLLDSLKDLVAGTADMRGYPKPRTLDKAYLKVLIRETKDKEVVWEKEGDFCYSADAGEAHVTLYGYPDYALTIHLSDTDACVLQGYTQLSELWEAVTKLCSNVIDYYLRSVIEEGSCAVNSAEQ